MKRSIHLITYKHRHGADFFVYASRKQATLKMIEIAGENRQEFLHAMKGLTNEECLHSWYPLSDYTEEITVEEMPVL